MPDLEHHPELIRRATAAQATLTKFHGKPFSWGTFDCARLAASHLRQNGYRVKAPPAGRYRTLRSAKIELANAGFSDLPDALDALGLPRIAPAEALTGDILQWPSVNEIAALGIVLNNGRMLAYHPEAEGATVMQPLEYIAAWRVVPL